MIGVQSSDDRGRIVVVAAGFALWVAGRCVGAARWADITRLGAHRRLAPAESTISLRVELRDGTVLELREEAPGYDAFLDRASATLSGLLPYSAWKSRLTDPDGPREGVILFERTQRCS